jgi:hypothetical protein
VRCGVRARPFQRVRRLFLPCLASSLLLGSAASAKPSITIIPFGRYPVERQLTQTLCSEVSCVGSGQVLRHGHVDWERVEAAQLTGVLTGKIERDSSGKKRLVDIQIMAPGHVVLVRKKAPLHGMALSSTVLHALTVELVGVLHRAHGPERVPVAEAAPNAADAAAPKPAEAAVAPLAAGAPGPVASAPAAPPAAPEAAGTAVGAAAAATAPSAKEVPAEAEAAPSPTEREPPLLEVQATLAFLNREYSYSQGASTNPILRNSTVPLVAEPGLLVGIFPLRSAKGLFASFGLEAAVATSVGLNVQRDNDNSGTIFPAASVSAFVQLLSWLRLGQTLRLAPLLGWQMMNFEVQKASDGTVLTGQPPVHWRAFKAGLKLDVDFSSWCTLFVELSYLYPYSAGALTSAPYFTQASAAPSFDSALGLAFRVAPPLEVRVGFVFTLYALGFSGPGPAPVTGVSDQLVGATLGVRYTY